MRTHRGSPAIPRRWAVAACLATACSLPSTASLAKDVKVVIGSGQSISLDQLTKEVLIARDRYANASGAERATLAKSLRQLVSRRQAILKATIAMDPAIVLRAALPEGAYDTMPPDVQPVLERSVSLEGVIEPLRASAPDAPKRFPYQLRDRRGRIWRLAPAGQTPGFAPGSTVKITGIQLGEMVVFRGENLTGASRSGFDTQPPRVVLDAPRQGETLRGTVTIRVSATDHEGVTQVRVTKDGTLIGTDETAPYEVSWDTRRDADGPHALIASASDPDLNLGTTPPVTVTVDNTPPRAHLIAPLPGTPVAGTVTLQAEAGDAIGIETVKFLVDGLAVGVAVSDPYVVSWDTTTVSNGTHAIEALAIDRAHNTTTAERVEVKVLNANHAPELIPIGSKTVPEGVTLAFTVSAVDRDGPKDPLAFQATNLPPWAHFDPTTRQVYGTPDFTEASQKRSTTVYEGVRFDVCDTQPLCDREEIAISVINVNRPPVMNPLGTHVVPEGKTLTITPIVTDPDGDPLTCQAFLLPPWMRFDAAACSAGGTPDFDLTSQDSPATLHQDVRFEVCDPEQQCAGQRTTIKVVNTNRRPLLDRIGDRSVDERKLLTFEVRARDPDHETVGIAASPLPDGATFTARGAGTGVLSWTPRADQAGSYAVTVVATDGSLEDAETIRVRVRETSLTIAGQILTDTGGRLAGATIELARAGERSRYVTTDAKGLYRASDLPPGTYILRPSIRSGNLPTSQILHFSPLSRQVELIDHDQRDVDFTALLKTR
ncbi:MAG: putative Ig domain-containing protein [Candidatus Omnitrophica bacterium]|nr:putative Ig domain-containing protein [Candidatus Omnitrophota bacterium]